MIAQQVRDTPFPKHLTALVDSRIVSGYVTEAINRFAAHAVQFPKNGTQCCSISVYVREKSDHLTIQSTI
jgi:hypothetical protein